LAKANRHNERKKKAKSGMQQTQSIKEFENLERNSFERVTLTAHCEVMLVKFGEQKFQSVANS
jgi:hypothetical protein